MAKYIYPAVFEQEGNQFTAYFPDFESCYTQGETLQEVFEMAEDVLCLTLYNLEENKTAIPVPSDPKNISVSGDAIVSLIACDTSVYRKYNDNNAERK